MTKVSVIVPAYRAGAVLGRALASVERCGWPEAAVEIVIAPDDGESYAGFALGWGRRTVLPPGPVASGAGPARNRALAAATGALVAFLDADDTWEAGYLAETVPLAQRSGLAFGRTSIRDRGREILRLPFGDSLVFDDFAATGASFHPVLKRAWAGPFAARPAQDILHAVEALALAGGSAALSDAAYVINLNSESTTATRGYANRVAAAYDDYAADILEGRTRVAVPFREQARAVFTAKAALNAAFAAEGRGSFYGFMADRLSGQTR